MGACCAGCATTGARCEPQGRVDPVPLRLEGATPLVGLPAVPVVATPQGAIGPELAQATKARRTWAAGIFSEASANSLRGQGRGRTTTVADIAQPPQVFVRQLSLVDQSMREAITGADMGWPGVPGRLPPASWDGEPGVTNPNRDAY